MGQTAVGEHAVLFRHFILSPPGTLILEIVIEALDDIAATVGRRLRKIRGFEVVYRKFDLSLDSHSGVRH